MLLATISTCKGHVGKFHCSNALELIVIQTRKQSSVKYFQFFTKVLSYFTSKIGNLILIFEKIKIKIVNAVICGKKLNAHATGNKLVFYLGQSLHVKNTSSLCYAINQVHQPSPSVVSTNSLCNRLVSISSVPNERKMMEIGESF